MKTRTDILASASSLVLCGVLLVVSQSLAQTSREEKHRAHAYQEIAKAPEKARAAHNPLESDPEAVLAGRVLFEQHCSECHGSVGTGSRSGPSLRADQIQSAAPGSIFWVLTNGVVWRGMPVWSKLPEPQRWQIVTYIKSLGPEPVLPATVKSPSIAGPAR